MAIAVMRVFGSKELHLMSVVSDGTETVYVGSSGKDMTKAGFDPDRPKRFAPVFKEEFGKDPESPEDWVEAGSLNLGWLQPQGPVENSYEDMESAISAEQSLIDASVESDMQKYAEEIEEKKRKKTFSDDQLEMRPEDSICVTVDPETSQAIYLTVEGNMRPVLYRENGMWTDRPDFKIDYEKMEDMNVMNVTADYVPLFDEEKRSLNDFEPYLDEEED